MSDSLDILRGVMVDDCWVLGWSRHDEAVSFELEASLRPGHPFYQSPKEGEWACYKRARLLFLGVQVVEGLLSQQQVKPTEGPDAIKDYGSIDSILAEASGYRIIGEFGDVLIRCNTMELVIEQT